MSELDELREQVARLTAMMAAKQAPPAPQRRARPEPTPPPPTPRADEEFEACRAGRRHLAYARRWPLPEQAANGASIPYDNPLCENCGANVVYSKPYGTTDAQILEKLKRSGVDLILPEPLEAKKQKTA